MVEINFILENVFGMLGVLFWSFQLVPQAWTNYRTKHVEGLSATMFILWTLASLGFGSYGLIQGLSIPLILQPQIFGVLSTTCFLQCMYYNRNSRHRWSLKTTLAGGTFMFLGMAGIEAGAYFATKAGLDHHVQGTIDAAGILPVVLLGLGFLPQFVDIYRDRSVVSVSMLFIAGDASGAVFSIISLAFRNEFDLLAAMNYIVVLVCDLVIVGFWVYFNKLHPEMSRANPIQVPSRTGDEESVHTTTITTRPTEMSSI